MRFTFDQFAGGCAFLYVLAQAFQEVVLRSTRTIASEQPILIRLNGADEARAFILLLSFFGLLAVFSALSLRCFEESPGPAVFGLCGGFLWIASELFYRTVDFFLVTRTWAVQYLQAGAASLQDAVAQRIHIWDELVSAWYFVLLLAYLIASVSFGLSIPGNRRRDKILSIIFFANSLSLVGRFLEEYAGQKWLASFNHAVHFPVVLSVFGFLGFWLIASVRNLTTSCRSAVSL